ncbi:MAG: S8 family serine peptidase, partial [Anaerolineales bacterium]|nr:S8 family serine peptidase [Anaerolineales bacterium]
MNKMILGLIIFIAVLTLAGLGEATPLQAEASRSWMAMQVNLQGETKIDPALETRLASAQPGEKIPVIVTLKAKADLSNIGGPDRQARLKGVIRALQAIAEASQRDVRSLIETRMAQELVSQVTYFWVFNGLSVAAAPEVIEELAARPDVLKITPDEITVEPEAGLAVSAPQPNLAIVNAPALWDLGFYGQGIVVASMDTGVDVNHPELYMRWRGGSNSWFDPYGQHPDTPMDLSGHGTQSMGVIVGGDASGTSIGVAPQAQWIAVKIFDDSGTATATAIHQGFQWLLNPDGHINTADAPHVVNNSWTFAYPGCDLEFEQDLLALQAAGILPVFAAGNGGPNVATSYSPANNPSAFAVGGTDGSDNIYLYSSRGPSNCGETEKIYPELVAPGVGIYTTDRYGQYTFTSGTSSSAPHVTGGIALLLTSFPNLSAYEQSAALVNSAFDLGLNGPDNTFGYGRLDLLAAYQLVQSGPLPTPTPDSSVNLAVNKLVDVSSYQDTAHTGDQA